MRGFRFDDIYMDLAIQLSRRSHCVKIQVGAVLSKDNRVVAVGYNGPPKGTYNCDEKWPFKGCPRTLTGGCSYSLHAEQNAILYASKNMINLEGSTLYVTLSPCLPCARVIFTMGIKKVFYLNSYSEYKNLPVEQGLAFLEEFDVKIHRYVKKNALHNI